ncbi:hypothetical protein MTR_0030s0360 [Medicago truncatula]|uniref:Uncharacterized protein n=1 Tax=Medicago truncatula TaxID=3880 RepID=G7ZUH4_MEDTR|nr:hypothetical protein MTR_0030s0360 [Medicago truncatula]
MKEEQTLPKDEIIKLKECIRMDLKIRLFHKLDFPNALAGARCFVAASSRWCGADCPIGRLSARCLREDKREVGERKNKKSSDGAKGRKRYRRPAVAGPCRKKIEGRRAGVS